MILILFTPSYLAFLKNYMIKPEIKKKKKKKESLVWFFFLGGGGQVPGVLAGARPKAYLLI